MPMHFSRDKSFERKPEHDESYVLLETVFKEIPKSQIIQIDVKDTDLNEAGILVIDLIRKYDRFDTTIMGSGKAT
eukprot:CAMPEP_0176376342 /NCGR_PEP_ID=MMETSP0126-20121128/28124_1 /TAXON_ID=141414 ORGANISM="Strombidinopsis acuminatum, Strain SPMC142" /NCGR_SAMPLE_ID=MMETSP0126 /ASSEMBLY_ACC=CAM_ASM_000229 /LENGTH=74 /DNA_ID=CAMNT_0017737747 /DNA_START=162 /DNA_END=386 /DNA_ORIENTATION=+